MLPVARVAHSTPGRIRLAVPSMRYDEEWFAAAAERLAALPAVRSARANSRTGSLLIQADTDTDLARIVSDAGLCTVDDEAANGTRHWPEIPAGSGLPLLFLALAALQLMRGQVMAPAVSLLWYALEAGNRRR